MIVLHGVPDMQKLVSAFQNRTVLFGNGDEVIAPYFAGYCGSHASIYPGLRQLAGDFAPVPESFVVAQQQRASMPGIPSSGKSGAFGSHRRASKRRRDDSDLGAFLPIII